MISHCGFSTARQPAPSIDARFHGADGLSDSLSDSPADRGSDRRLSGSAVAPATCASAIGVSAFAFQGTNAHLLIAPSATSEMSNQVTLFVPLITRC